MAENVKVACLSKKGFYLIFYLRDKNLETIYKAISVRSEYGCFL